MTIFEADWICPISSPPIRNAFLAVDGETISEVTSSSPENNSHQGAQNHRVTFPGCVIIPGFVNVHAHLELTILRGFLEDLPFNVWIPRLTRAKYQELTQNELLTSARLGVIDMLSAGVTCVGEVMDLGVSWQAMREFGLQGVAFQEVFGPSEDQTSEALKGLQSKVTAYRKEQTATLKPGISPHAPYTVSPKLFREVNAYARSEGLLQTTHIAESQQESLFVRKGTGPFADRLRDRGIPVEAQGVSPIAYIDRLGLIGPEMLLVHAVDVDEADIETLRRRGARIAHCPKSNAKFAHGIAPIANMMEAKILVGLGTDSVASNNVIDMFEEMRTAIFQQRSLTRRLEALDAQSALNMATLGGAECLGLEKHLGSLEAGKRADFVVVDLDDCAVQPIYDPVQTMVYSASRRNIRATYVGGREARPESTDLMHEYKAIGEKLSRA